MTALTARLPCERIAQAVDIELASRYRGCGTELPELRLRACRQSFGSALTDSSSTQPIGRSRRIYMWNGTGWWTITQQIYWGPGMTSSPIDVKPAVAQEVTVTDEALTVDLADGRSVSVPLTWFPRLFNGTPTERTEWRLIGSGEGIHWPALDEDISVQSLLAGRGSGETDASLQRWLQARRAAG